MARMCRRIALIQGHPDSKGGHFWHALAEACAAGARAAGFHVDLIEVATLDVPFLRSRNALEHDDAPPQIHFRPHQEASALRLGGATPVKETLIGRVEATNGSTREQWLRRMWVLGAEAR